MKYSATARLIGIATCTLRPQPTTELEITI